MAGTDTARFDFEVCRFYNEAVNEHRIELTLGALILIAPWLLGFSDVPLARWTDVLCGLALVLINIWSLFGSDADTAAETAATGPQAEPVTLAALAVAPAVSPKRVRRTSSSAPRPRRIRLKKVEEVSMNP